MSFKDHFSTQASVYAKARPLYPPVLFAELASWAPGRSLAWDCGAGNGQASVGLARYFNQVIATEPSAAQLAEAVPHAHVTYVQSAELAPGVADASVDLVTAAQAAHWFNRPAFYAEARRVLRPGGVVALWSYGLCAIEPAIDALVFRFYDEKVGPFWPPERRDIETGYRDFEFPFVELPFPRVAMEHYWTHREFATYLRTWSSVVRFIKAHGHDPVVQLEEALGEVWGTEPRLISWPLSGRIGRV
jgi:SAM-dependent methyltransferase